MAETVDDLIMALIAEVEGTLGEVLDGAPGQYWLAALNAFAADIVNRVLPDDPVAQAAVIRKARALGIDIDNPPPGNVVSMLDHVPRKYLNSWSDLVHLLVWRNIPSLHCPIGSG